MSEQFHLNQEYLLTGRLAGLTEGEIIALGRGLCLALHDRAGRCVGGVQAGNVSFTPEGEVGLGGGGSVAADRKWSSEELEYLAPELFWSGSGTVQADLYAVGLMLYAALNNGRMPFAASETMSAAERAKAFKLRMSGQPLPEPEHGSPALRQTVMKALSFAPDGRWKTPAELLHALNACAEACETPVPVPAGLVMELPDEPETPEAEPAAPETETAGTAAPEEMPAAPQEHDAPAEAAEPVPAPAPEAEKPSAARPHDVPPAAQDASAQRRRVMPYIVAGVACVAIILAALLLRSFHKPANQPGENQPGTPIDVSVPNTPDENQPSEPDDPAEPDDPENPGDPAEPDDPESPGDPTEPDDPSGPDAENNPTNVTTPTQPTLPTQPTQPTEPDEPKPSETQTENPRYELVIRDCSWSMAKALCEQMGGHLVTISDETELAEVTKLADSKGIGLVWAGAYRDLMGNWSWVTGEQISFFRWGKGQPSAYDSDGTAEDYLMLWKRKGSWIYNDSRNDPVADYPTAYSGKIGFICEYEDR